MKKEFIVNRQGKDFVLYAGLLDQAHHEGLKRISTRLVQAPSMDNGNMAICTAEVETEKGIFTGIGDACPDNVGRMIAMHCIRMAETRAKARALRDAINVGVTAFEELGDIEEDTGEMRPTQQRAQQARQQQPPQAPRQLHPAATPPARQQQAPAAAPARQPAPMAPEAVRLQLDGLQRIAGIEAPISEIITTAEAVQRIDAIRKMPATSAQVGVLNALGQKIFNAFKVDLGPQIPDTMTIGKADAMLIAFKGEHDRLAAGAQKNAPQQAAPAAAPAESSEPASQQQIDKLHKLQSALGRSAMVSSDLNTEEATRQISELVRIFNAQSRGPKTGPDRANAGVP